MVLEAQVVLISLDPVDRTLGVQVDQGDQILEVQGDPEDQASMEDQAVPTLEEGDQTLEVLVDLAGPILGDPEDQGSEIMDRIISVVEVGWAGEDPHEEQDYFNLKKI